MYSFHESLPFSSVTEFFPEDICPRSDVSLGRLSPTAAGCWIVGNVKRNANARGVLLSNLPEAIEKRWNRDGGWTAADTCRRCFSRGETNVCPRGGGCCETLSRRCRRPRRMRREGSAQGGSARADLRVVLEWQSNYKNINLSVFETGGRGGSVEEEVGNVGQQVGSEG